MNLFVFKVKRFVRYSLSLLLGFFLCLLVLISRLVGSSRLSSATSWLELTWVNVHQARSGSRYISGLFSVNKSHKIFCAKVLRLEQRFKLNVKRLLAELSWLVVNWGWISLLLVRQKFFVFLLLLLVWLFLRVLGNNMTVVRLLKSFGELLCDV